MAVPVRRAGPWGPARVMRSVAQLVAGMFLGIGCAAAETVNRIVAIVNEEVITEADVTSRINSLLEDADAPLPEGHDATTMHQMVLRRLIEQRVILQEGKRLGVQVGADEILKRLEALRGRFSTPDEFEQSLSDSGLSKEQLKESIRDQLTIQHVIDAKIRSAIVVSPQEVAQELSAHPELAKPGDRVRASHLLIRVTEERSEASARALIEDLHRQLTQGADFPSLAKRYSEDPHAEAGGEMGWVAQGELLPELDAALFSVKEGMVSSPIQTRLGFHLVKVEERRTATSLSVMEANRAVYQQLYQQKFQEAFARWLAELKRHAYIEIVTAP
ncbi:MAG: peptidylprolyl isomerase [Candidatus Omnitrophica bacterium]|nr:peptidylprolyl isomerase [Candidatus Omnitrophota bacterium]